MESSLAINPYPSKNIMLSQFLLNIDTSGRGIFDITPDISACLKQSNIETGLCHVFLHHTSASLIICENADPQVQHDLESFMQKLVPDGDNLFKHTQEGPDDMPAHVRNILTSSFVIIPVTDKKLALGTWQSIYLWEHRIRPYKRKITVTIQGL